MTTTATANPRILNSRHLWPQGLTKIDPTSEDNPYTWDHRKMRSPYGRDYDRLSKVPAWHEELDHVHGGPEEDNHARHLIVMAWYRAGTEARIADFQLILTKAAPAWKTYTTSRSALDRTYEALQNTSNTVWNAAILTLHRAQDDCLKAAQKFDGLMYDAHKRACEITQNGWGDSYTRMLIHESRYEAAIHNANPTGDWEISRDLRDYLNHGPLTDHVQEVIDSQREALTSAARMMPGTAT